MWEALGWALIAAIGFVPAMLAAAFACGCVVTVVGWLPPPIRPAWAEVLEDDDAPPRPISTRATCVIATALAASELAVVFVAGSLFGRPAAFEAVGAAALGALGLVAVLRRIPPYAGFDVAPAVLAGGAGAGFGALLGALARAIF